MSKGIIISHDKGGSYVLMNNGTFRFVKGYTRYSVGDEIDLDPEEAHRRLRLIRLMLPAACISLVFIFAGFYYALLVEVHTIYIKINPGVELNFNRVNRLVSVNPVNDDGVFIVDYLQLRGTPENVVVSIVRGIHEHNHPILEEFPVLLIAIATRGGLPAQELEHSVNAALYMHGLWGFALALACEIDYIAICEQERGIVR